MQTYHKDEIHPLIVYKLAAGSCHEKTTSSNTGLRKNATECYLGVPEAKFLFNTFRDTNSLEKLYITSDGLALDELDDDVMAGCIPSLAACSSMQKLQLFDLNMSTRSCAALGVIVPRMAALHELDLSQNFTMTTLWKLLFEDWGLQASSFTGIELQPDRRRWVGCAHSRTTSERCSFACIIK